MPWSGVEGTFSEEEWVVVDDDDDDDDRGLVKLPGAMTKATRTIQAKRLARILCERGILSMLRAMFMYLVWKDALRWWSGCGK